MNDEPRRRHHQPSSPLQLMIASAPLFASLTSSPLDDDGSSGEAYGSEDTTNPLSALLRKLRGAEARAPSKLQVAISSVLGNNDSTSSSSSSSSSPNSAPSSSPSSSSTSSTSTSATTFRPSAKFLSSRLGRAWLEQLESQRALLTGAAGAAAGAAARAAGAADRRGRAKLADAKATLGAQLAWDRAKAEWLASQLLEAGENGILNPASIVLDAYVAGKARYYLRRHALRTAAVLATACLLIDGLKAAAAVAARRAAASRLMAPFPRVREAAAAAIVERETAAAAAAAAEEEEETEKKKGGTTTEGEGEEPASSSSSRRKNSRKLRRLLGLAASGAVALGRKAVEAALPTPMLAAWLVAELML